MLAFESPGYHPEVILAGRRINDSMGRYVARRAVKLLFKSNQRVAGGGKVSPEKP